MNDIDKKMYEIEDAIILLAKILNIKECQLIDILYHGLEDIQFERNDLIEIHNYFIDELKSSFNCY